MCGIWAFSILWFYFAYMNLTIDKLPEVETAIAGGVLILGGTCEYFNGLIIFKPVCKLLTKKYNMLREADLIMFLINIPNNLK